MLRLLFTALAFATIIASVDGQDPIDVVKANEPGQEHENLKADLQRRQEAMTIEMFEVATDGKETLVMKVRGEKQK